MQSNQKWILSWFMSEYSQLLIFDHRFLIVHMHMQSTQTMQHANREKSGSHRTVVELLIRRGTTMNSQRQKSNNKWPFQFGEVRWGEVSWGEEKTTSFMTLVNTSRKQPVVFSKNRTKLVAAEVLVAGGSILGLGQLRATQRWHQLLLPTSDCVVLLFRCSSPLQLCPATGCGSTG